MPTRILAPPGTRALIFGDSWVQGYAASPLTKGFAYLTAQAEGWSATIVSDSGGGYLNGFDRSPASDYLSQIEDLPKKLDPRIILLSGGVNDTYINHDDFAVAADLTFAAMKNRFPKAMVVVVGPGQAEIPLAPGYSDVDTELRAACARAGLHYISPIALHWFNKSNYSKVIDRAKLDHPTTYGHSVFAQGLIAALHQIGAPADR